MSPNIDLDGAPSAQFERSGSLTTPPELTRPSPRTVRMTGDGTTTMVYALVLLALAVAGFVWFSMRAVQGLELRDALRRSGVVASGEITRLHYAGKSRILVVTYTFSVGGTFYRGEAPAPGRLRHTFQEHDFLDVRYLSNNPALNHPAAWEQSTLSALTPLIVPFVPVLLAYLFLIDLPFEKRLAAEGMFAAATVTNTFSARSGFGVKYEFHTPDGATVEGSRVCDSRREIGTKIQVIYLPQNPQRNQIYPLRYYRVAG